MSSEITVSVIVPIYNEEKHIDGLISSLAGQSFPKEKSEWIFLDGMSTDNTVEIINNYIEGGEYPIVLLPNEKRKAPYALNLGIEAAKGSYIIRLDAHADYYPDYIEKCVYYLENTDADNVGGMAETSAEGLIGLSISKMLSTKFGVGGSDFRTGNGNRYADTVPFGAFRREVFDRVGLFNTELIRSEDNDMNARIRESGGKIWLAEDIRFKYFCRDTIGGILKMGFMNGNALFHTIRKNPKAMSVRHFIPFVFVLSLIVMPIISAFLPFFWWAFAAEMALYMLLNVYFSFIKIKPTKCGLITIWLYPAFHVVYGIGSLLGLLGIKTY
ncbi:MAG: glycosyltransferase family 2 protein [Ruminococcaceae bacterium]|nr:glycosyltransferase family 2 protein [Oscillospiraceae bacterium]